MKWRISESGQVAVEYVLLLVVAVLIWISIVSLLVSRDPNNPGSLISAWNKITIWIGKDEIEKQP